MGRACERIVIGCLAGANKPVTVGGDGKGGFPIMHMFTRWIAAVAVTLAATPGQAQINVPVDRWVVDYGNIRCSLARRANGARSNIVILSSYLGRDEPEFIIVAAGDPLATMPRRVVVTLEPSAERAEANVVQIRRTGGMTLNLRDLPEGFIDRFAESTSVSIAAEGRAIIQMPTPEARAAVAALRSCNDDLFQSWGIDVAARRQLRQRAEQTGGAINDSDYPSSAISAGLQGVVVTRFTVTATGEVSNCVVVVSSSVPILDQTSCWLITRRFRYRPAIGADGQPVAQGTIRTINWRLPIG